VPHHVCWNVAMDTCVTLHASTINNSQRANIVQTIKKGNFNETCSTNPRSNYLEKKLFRHLLEELFTNTIGTPEITYEEGRFQKQYFCNLMLGKKIN
jgi:hypothetical protein